MLKNKSSDMDLNSIILYDENQDELLRSKYEFLGIYENTSRIWTWAWSMAVIPKNVTYTSRKLLSYGLDIPSDQVLLKTELITSRFRIASEIQLQIHCAIAAYISKKPIIYRLKYPPDVDYDEKIHPIVKDSEKYRELFLFLHDYDT